MDRLKELYLSTYFLVDYNFIKEDTVVKKFLVLLKVLLNSDNIEEILDGYNSFLLSLQKKDFSYYLKKALLTIDTIENSNEFRIISDLSKVKFQDIKEILKIRFKEFSGLFDNMPGFENSDLRIENLKEAKKIDTRAFVFSNDFELAPVEFIEKTKFSDLKGYEYQKRVLFENTKALLDNSKVNNILLYGDAGCGKSTSVRALLNEFRDIKIVQIFKDNLIHLDKLFEKLRNLPYKFIIFADDISFDETDETLSTMKAILEGSIIQCPINTVIYATSNRRHLVKETFQSRNGDEIHLKDTLNEIGSLSERFGINLLFSKPTNEEFIDIVLKLASDNNIDLPENELIARAQRHALIKGSNSPRIARQLIDNLLAKVNL